MPPINRLLADNPQALDNAKFTLQLAELLEADNDALRRTLSHTAVDTPHLTLQLCAALLGRLRNLRSAPMCDKRQIVFYAAKRCLDVLCQQEFHQQV